MEKDGLHRYQQIIVQLTRCFPGPLRHPRPLTAADLHMQLEKEQEAVVSRGLYMARIICLIRALLIR